MKVKFENCEVDVWRLRWGAVVFYKNQPVHIKMLGTNQSECGAMQILVSGQLYDSFITSTELTWLEPH